MPLSTEALESKMQWWWDTHATSMFAHREYSGLLGERGIVQSWQRNWLSRFCADGRCNSTRVADYGIGAAILGEFMMNVYGVVHYDGVDISRRSLDAARTRLSLHFPSSRFALHNTSVDFASLASDVFISQAVIQHCARHTH